MHTQRELLLLQNFFLKKGASYMVYDICLLSLRKYLLISDEYVVESWNSDLHERIKTLSPTKSLRIFLKITLMRWLKQSSVNRSEMKWNEMAYGFIYNFFLFFLQNWMAFTNLSVDNFTITDSLVFTNTNSPSDQDNYAFCQVRIIIASLRRYCFLSKSSL